SPVVARDRRCRPGCLLGSTGWLRTAAPGIARPCWCSAATRALWRCVRRGLTAEPAAPAESEEPTGLPAVPLRPREPARSTGPARWPWAVRWTAPGAESERARAHPADTAWAAPGRAAGSVTAQPLVPGRAGSGPGRRVRVHRVVRRARVDQAVRLVPDRPVPDHWAARRAARATAGRPASRRCRREGR